MKCILMVLIKSPKYPFFIEIAKEIKLPFHPNIKDVIDIDELHCEITEVRFDYSEDTLWLKAYVPEDYLNFNDSYKEKFIDSILKESNEMKDYGWYINDWDLGDRYIMK